MDFVRAQAAEYYERGYWKPQDLWSSVVDRTSLHPDRIALIADDERVSFRELVAGAAKAGCALQARGIGPGDVVVVHGRNDIAATQALLACAYAGAVVAPLPPMFSVNQLAGICGGTCAKAVIGLGDAKEVARSVEAARRVASVGLIVVPDAMCGSSDLVAWSQPDWGAAPNPARGRAPGLSELDPDQPALLVYSSGTTGAPKGVMHSANTVRYAIEQRALLHEVGPLDTALVVSQFGFVGSVVFGLLFGLLTGATSVLMANWNGDAAVRLIERHRITYGLFMPTHVHDLLASALLDGADLSSLRRCAMGGLTQERRTEVRRRLHAVPLPAYGMSECLGYTSHAVGAPERSAITTDGHPYPGTQTKIVDDNGRELPAGTAGSILVRGPSRFLGYYQAPEQTDAAIDADGYFRTGDLGSLDEDGYITFISRQKDIIRRGGVTIIPADLERVLARHHRIEHVAVVALPDTRLGERACACIVTRDSEPIALDELTAFLQAQDVARYTWPECVARFAAFPRSASLKVQKPALLEHLARRDPSVLDFAGDAG